VAYVAWQKGKVSSSLPERLAALRRAEERAKTRDLTTGLQPLYYALEAFDELFPGEGDVSRHELDRIRPVILGTVEAVNRFINEREDRDSGGQIARRVDSIRLKLRAANVDDAEP
jgi:hypothetical protein